MNNLNDLISEYGEPNALIDNFNLEFGYAIWGYEQIYHYSINGQYYNNNPIEEY